MPKFIPKRMAVDSAASYHGLRKPLLMAPAGDWDCVNAAIENGADAVYFGLDRFNARMRANNFTRKDLPELMAKLHHRGVKGFITFNTLVFTDELHDAVEFLKSVIAAGVDAAIVQDVGVCRLIRQLSPDFPIHASTQMSISSEAGVHFSRELGASLTVLSRECSLQEVASIKSACVEKDVDQPLEIFVHGALCVAYSGQCLTSEALGGRSANRGECAQACRLPYELYADGEKVELGEQKYLLSPQDLAGIDLVPEIIKAGVHTLKIEGRLKNPEYVAAVSKVYRKAIDDAWEQLNERSPLEPVSDDDRYTLEMTFSRGLDTGWLEGIDNQRLVHARFGKKRGVQLGIVEKVTPKGVWIDAKADMNVSDGVVFAGSGSADNEEGGRIDKIETNGNKVFISFFKDSVKLSRLKPGQVVWKTSDPQLDKALKKTFQVEQPNYRRAIDVKVSGAVGEKFRLNITDREGCEVTVESEDLIQKAEKHALDEKSLRKQLGRLGSTVYQLGELDIQLGEQCMFPMSALNGLRRKAIEALDIRRKQPREWQLDPQFRLELPEMNRRVDRKGVYFIPFVRSWDQFEAVLPLHNYKEIYLELENPRDYSRAVKRFRDYNGSHSGRSIWVAPARMFKPGEDWIIDKLLKCDADGYLVRNHEHLNALQDTGKGIRGDFSLNISNPVSADWYYKRWNLKRLTASYDLNHLQLLDLLRKSPGNLFEITLHQHMPMFHMEHCIYCAFLTDGKDFSDCGRPCDTRNVELQDRVGMKHPLKADAGCRNTVFNAKAQSGAEYLDEFIDAGVNAFRIEFLNESPREVLKTLDCYERLLRKKMSTSVLWKDLKIINQLGVTRGTLK